MAEMIPFPDKEAQLFASGTRKMLAQDYLAAKKDFEALYDLNPSFEGAQQLVEVYRLLGDFEGALFYAQEYEAKYLAQTDLFESYIHLLLLDTQYLYVHRLLKNYPNEKLEKDLIQLETAQEFIGAHDLQIKEQLFENWSHLRQPILGAKWKKWLKGLSLSRFIHLTNKYLPTTTNPFLLPKVIEELVYCGVKETIGVKNIFGQFEEINLADVKLLNQSPQLALFLQLINDVWANDDLQLAEGIAMEGQAHFSLLYPFLPTVNEVPDWVESYGLEYKGMFGDEQAMLQLNDYEKIQQIKQKLRELYQELM